MQAFFTKRIEISWLELIAYVIGIWMCVHGALGFGADIELEKTWAVMKDELFHVLFMIWGILICGAAWLRYRGGLWSVAGAYLVGGALYDSVLIVQAHKDGTCHRVVDGVSIDHQNDHMLGNSEVKVEDGKLQHLFDGKMYREIALDSPQ
jgi:hypothetical protein